MPTGFDLKTTFQAIRMTGGRVVTQCNTSLCGFTADEATRLQEHLDHLEALLADIPVWDRGGKDRACPDNPARRTPNGSIDYLISRHDGTGYLVGEATVGEEDLATTLHATACNSGLAMVAWDALPEHSRDMYRTQARRLLHGHTVRGKVYEE